MLDYGNINNRSFVKLDYRFAQYKKYNQILGSPFTSASSGTAREGVAAHGGGPDEDAEYFNTEEDYERFINFNLGFNYTVKNRYNLTLNIPVFFNSHHIDVVEFGDGDIASQTNRGAGLGDINVGIQRIFTIDREKMKHTFKLGGNLYFPTGKYEVNNLLTENVHLQPGRTVYAADFIGTYNIEEVGFWGVNILANVYTPFNKKTFNSSSSLNYKFGNRYSLDVNWYKIFNGTLKKALILGINNEVSDQELVNEFVIEDTGYYILQANLGGTVSKNRVLVNAEANLPIFQSLNGLQLKSQVRFSLTLMYYLNKIKE